MGKSTLILGNCIEKMQDIEQNSIHAIISDIPYGIGYADWDVLHDNKNSAYGKSSPSQESVSALFKRRGKPLNGWSEQDKNISLEYQQWCETFASEFFRLLKPGASCLIFAGRRYAHRCITAMENSGFTFKDMLAWEKNKAPQRAQHISEVYKRRKDYESAEKWDGWRVANPKPIFEPILWFQKPYKIGGTLADNILENGVGAWNEESFLIYNKEEYGNCISNLVKVDYEKTDSGLHPTQKPAHLMEFLVSLVTKEEQVVLDPFMGSGTTGVACRILNRDFIGIEANEDYYNIAKNRIKD